MGRNASCFTCCNANLADAPVACQSAKPQHSVTNVVVKLCDTPPACCDTKPPRKAKLLLLSKCAMNVQLQTVVLVSQQICSRPCITRETADGAPTTSCTSRLRSRDQCLAPMEQVWLVLVAATVIGKMGDRGSGIKNGKGASDVPN